MTISKRLRFEVLRRDEYRCRYCGRSPSDDGVKLHVDHVIPVALGGTDSIENLCAACIDCNTGKSSSSPDADVASDVARSVEAQLKARGEVLAIQAEARAQTELLEDIVLARWGPSYLPGDWRCSIANMSAAGADGEMIEEALDVTHQNARWITSSRWAYFCGCVWRRINDLDEAIARRMREE